MEADNNVLRVSLLYNNWLVWNDSLSSISVTTTRCECSLNDQTKILVEVPNVYIQLHLEYLHLKLQTLKDTVNLS